MKLLRIHPPLVLLMSLQKTPIQGAYGVIIPSIDPTFATDKEKRGGYFFHGELLEPSDAAKDEKAAQDLWDLSETLTKLKDTK